MKRPKAMVIAAPGTNRDPDAAAALSLAGAEPETELVGELVAAPDRLDTVDLAVVAGGFSYGDALGAGRVMALELAGSDGGRLGEALRSFVASGRPVLGVCNGFQVLTRCGLVPGALGHNASGHFDCRWVQLAPEKESNSVWLDGADDEIHAPIAHGEGRYVHDAPGALATAGQVALRYASTNPNGSVDDIAGVSDQSGVVLGLMPHPENHMVVRQHPAHRRGGGGEHTLGLRMFRAGVRHASGL